MIIATVMGTAISSVGMYSSGPTRSFLIWVSLDENVLDNYNDNEDNDVENDNHDDNENKYVENDYHDDNEDNDVECDNHNDNKDNDVESLMQIYLFSSITLLHPPHHPAPPAHISVMKVKVKVNLSAE